MLVFIQRKYLFTGIVVIVLLTGGLWIIRHGFARVVAKDFDYRVFVAGVGTVEGKWSGETGVAVVGLETRPAAEKDRELKVIDLLVANGSSVKLEFQSDVFLINRRGERYGLRAQGQPKVFIDPGALSQGTVIISVPKGVPDNDWVLEIRGGNLRNTIFLPVRVNRVTSEE